MKKNTQVIIASIVGLLIVIGSYFGVTYNSLVNLETDVETQFAAIETKLQRRYDLIPNLVNSVKGAMKHEEEVFTAIADARAAMMGAGTVNGKIEASNQLEGALSRLMVISESYPSLKSDKHVANLMDELSGSENRISVERDRYNKVVGEFNKKIRKFPANLVAKMLGFEKMTAFEAVQGADVAPTVNLTIE